MFVKRECLNKVCYVEKTKYFAVMGWGGVRGWNPFCTGMGKALRNIIK